MAETFGNLRIILYLCIVNQRKTKAFVQTPEAP